MRVELKSIAFYLTPKNEVIFEYEDASLRQLIEKMDHHGYTHIPILDAAGRYVESVSDGDVLKKLLSLDPISRKEAEKIKLEQIPKHHSMEPVLITADLADLFSMIMVQNFVPVIDDQGIFIGIITRKDILLSLEHKLFENADTEVQDKK